MKKIKLSLLLLLFISNCIGQTQSEFFAGPQITTARYMVRDNKQSTDYKFGFQAGFGLKIPFDIKIFFAPEIYYSLKGYKVTLTDAATPPDLLAENNNTTIHSIEIAPLLQFDFGKNASHLFLKVGPAMDLVFSGHEKFDLKNGEKVSRDMKFSFGDYGRFTAQAIAQFGFESKQGFIIFVHYDYGLGSLNNHDDGPTIKHRIFGVSVGVSHMGHKGHFDKR